MILTDSLPQSHMMETSSTMVRTVIIEEPPKSTIESTTEPISINDNSCSITAIKIPLVSSEPILATSSKYILVNEFTKRKNQLVLYDDHLERYNIRSFINQPIIDALWYDKELIFLLLTEKNIFAFDSNTKEIQLIDDIIPNQNKIFKCFTLLNHSMLLIAYNEWGAEYMDQWEQNNENGAWKCIQNKELKLTDNEFIGNMLINDDSNLIITIYNILTEQWRMEIRNFQTMISDKTILLPGTNISHDYRIISIQNTNSDVKFLVFSSADSKIIAIDSNGKKIQLNYRHPVQRMALFQNNYLIIRTKERVDIHSFL